MCLATEHHFECVGCDRFVTGTMTISQFCRRKEGVDDTVGRFVFPGTNDLIIFPKAGQKANYYEGQEEERAKADAHLNNADRTEDTIIPHRYFRFLADFVRPRFCKDCLQEKHAKDIGTSKQLDCSLARVHRDNIDTTYARHLLRVKEGWIGSDDKADNKAAEKTDKDVNIFDGEWCYYVPAGYNSKSYEQKRKGWRDIV